MNTATLLGNAASALVLCLSLAIRAQDPPPGPAQGPGGLVPVQPLPPAPADPQLDPGAGAPPARSALFNAREWQERLLDPHLLRREVAFDELTSVALMDPEARGWLQGLAAGGGEPDLAWTARLALREVTTKSTLLQLGAGRLYRPSPAGALDELRRWMESVQGASPWGPWAVQPEVGLPGLGSASPGGPQVVGIAIEPDEQGRRLTVRQVVDGELQERTYRGPSLEAILAENPELAGQLGTGRVPGWLTPRVGPGLDRDATPEVETQPDPALLGVGLAAVPDDQRVRLGLEPGVGGLVLRIAPGSYAQLMGITPGAVLLQLQGQPIDSLDRVSILMAERDPGDWIEAIWVDAGGQRRRAIWAP